MTTIDYKYVIATFEECDVSERLRGESCYEELFAYIKDNGLLDEVIMYAVDYMRDWFDWNSGDAMWDAIELAVRKVTGKSVYDWEEEHYAKEGE